MSKSDALHKISKENERLRQVILKQGEKLLLLAKVVNKEAISSDELFAAELTAADIIIEFIYKNQSPYPIPMYVSQRFAEEWDKFFEEEFKAHNKAPHHYPKHRQVGADFPKEFNPLNLESRGADSVGLHDVKLPKVELKLLSDLSDVNRPVLGEFYADGTVILECVELDSCQQCYLDNVRINAGYHHSQCNKTGCGTLSIGVKPNSILGFIRYCSAWIEE